MPKWEQLKAYIQNPDVALSEVKHKYEGMMKDIDDDTKAMSTHDAEMWNQKVPGANIDPMAMYNTLESAQGLGNVAGIAKAPTNPIAQAALQKLIDQANKGSFGSSAEAALYTQLTGKIVPVENATTTAANFERLKKLRGY